MGGYSGDAESGGGCRRRTYDAGRRALLHSLRLVAQRSRQNATTFQGSSSHTTVPLHLYLTRCPGVTDP